MEIKWLMYLDHQTYDPKRHAFPVDEKTYGDWSLCGRGSGSSKAEGDQPLCGKCQAILNHYSESKLVMKRMVQAGEADLYEGQGL